MDAAMRRWQRDNTVQHMLGMEPGRSELERIAGDLTREWSAMRTIHEAL
jgi:hypothetical protein